jgi:hypothetical protein
MQRAAAASRGKEVAAVCNLHIKLFEEAAIPIPIFMILAHQRTENDLNICSSGGCCYGDNGIPNG